MQSLTRCLKDFLKLEDGPTTFEYAVMLSMIIAVCVGAVTTLGSKTAQPFPKVSNAVNVSSS